jgi:hypothetical protein
MAQEQITVAGLFSRAQAIRQSNPNLSYKQIKDQLVSEFSGKSFPSPTKLAIPEQDAIAPEEDWTAGLPVVLRGIQLEDWKEIAHGIIICLEQVENFQKDSGSESAPEKEWHNRAKGIGEFAAKSTGKWMPEDLINIAERAANK